MFIPLDDLEATVIVAKNINSDPKNKARKIRVTGVKIEDGKALMKLTDGRFTRWVDVTPSK